MKKDSEPYPSWEEYNKHEKRIAKLEKKVAQLLEASNITSDEPAAEIVPEPVPKSPKPVEDKPAPHQLRSSDDMSPALQSIVVQLRNGDSDGAFRKFQKLPKSELIQQPVTAATLAAAICVTQGNFQAGIKALEQVQQFSDDPRIEQIRQKLLEQAKKHKP